MNTPIVIGTTVGRHYFTRLSNLDFHDLTQGQVVPHITKTILGLSRKIIPTKQYTTNAEESEKPQFNFRRDAYLKSFFAGSPLNHKPPKLYVKSKMATTRE